MNEEIKNGLLNAGFKKSKSAYLINRGEFHTIYIPLLFANEQKVIIDIKIGEVQKTILTKDWANFEELSKICYTFNGCKDLNFKAKSYQWEDCVKEDGFFIDTASNVRGLEHVIDDLNRNAMKSTFTTESAAISGGLAHPMISQVVEAINADFECNSNELNYYPTLSHGVVDWACMGIKINPFAMNSEEAVKKLIETNTPLLLQYFEQ